MKYLWKQTNIKILRLSWKIEFSFYYSNVNIGCPSSTFWPFVILTELNLPLDPALTSISIFIDSRITIVWSADTESPGFATIFTTTPFTGATTLLPEPEEVLVFASCTWLVSFEGAAVILISVPGATWTLYFSPSSSIVYEETSPEDSCFLGEASTSSEPLFFLTLTFVSPFKN